MSKITQLPKETFLTITSYLDKRDNFNCIRVCRLWYDIITSSHLYNEVYLDNIITLVEAITAFCNNAKLGPTVKALTIENTVMEYHTARCLLKLTPNVQILKWLKCQPTIGLLADKNSYDIIAKPFKNWKKIEEILFKSQKSGNNDGIWFIFRNLFKNIPLFPYLTALKIDCHIGRKVIDQLNGVPTLCRFSLSHCTINLNNMEVLHTKALALEELALIYVDLETIDDAVACISDDGSRLIGARNNDFVTEIAENMKILVMEIGMEEYIYNVAIRKLQDFKACAKWFSCIGHKYHNLEIMMIDRLNNDALEPLPVVNGLICKPLTHTFSKMNNSQKISNMLYPFINELANAIYQSKARPTILEITVHLAEFKTQIAALEKTKFIKNIERFYIMVTEAPNLLGSSCETDSVINITKKMSSVKTLYIVCAEESLNFDNRLPLDLLSNVPQSLTALALDHIIFITPVQMKTMISQN